jgi:thiamine monophosphate synthase
VMLMLVTRDDERLPSIVRAAVEGGVNMVQVRGGDADAICAAVGARARIVVNAGAGGRAFSPLAGRRCREAADEGRHPGSFRPSPGAARHPLPASGARGLHLPETAPFVKAPFVGRSVHSVNAALRAEAEGCAYVVAGSVFPTASHPGGPVGGLELLRDIAAAVHIPVIAIGGINATNARSCIDAGARGVAVISAIFDADDPKRAAEELWRAIA